MAAVQLVLKGVSEYDCFATLPSRLARALDERHARTFGVYLFKVTKVGGQGPVFISWSGRVWNPPQDDKLGIPSMLLDMLEWREGEVVTLDRVEFCGKATEIVAQPLTAGDYEVIETNHEAFEKIIGTQLRVVQPGLIVPIWFNASLVKLRVKSIEPPGTAAVIVGDVHLVVETADPAGQPALKNQTLRARVAPLSQSESQGLPVCCVAPSSFEALRWPSGSIVCVYSLGNILDAKTSEETAALGYNHVLYYSPECGPGEVKFGTAAFVEWETVLVAFVEPRHSPDSTYRIAPSKPAISRFRSESMADVYNTIRGKWRSTNLLVLGRAGTGKTFLLRSLSHALGVYVEYVSIRELKGNDAKDKKSLPSAVARAARRCAVNAPCILAIDDAHLWLGGEAQSQGGPRLIHSIAESLEGALPLLGDGGKGVCVILSSPTREDLPSSVSASLRFEEDVVLRAGPVDGLLEDVVGKMVAEGEVPSLEFGEETVRAVNSQGANWCALDYVRLVKDVWAKLASQSAYAPSAATAPVAVPGDVVADVLKGFQPLINNELNLYQTNLGLKDVGG